MYKRQVCLGLLSACERADILGLAEALALGWVFSLIYRRISPLPVVDDAVVVTVPRDDGP